MLTSLLRYDDLVMVVSVVKWLLLWALLSPRSVQLLALSSSSPQIASDPPLLNVPVYSLATTSADGSRTNMNILTYATPVSIRPNRLWAIGLFKDTLSHEQFIATGRGVLQLLTTQHVPLVATLGGTCGRDGDKKRICAELGFPWIDDDKLLPNCANYLTLECVQVIEGGSHDIAICQVTKIETDVEHPTADHLMTDTLRDLGIITIEGRIDTSSSQNQMRSQTVTAISDRLPEQESSMSVVDTILSYAPRAKPKLWLNVNIFVFAYSVLLLVVNTFFTEDSVGVRFSAASYLYYSLITTVIWAVFAGLDVAYDDWDTQTWEKRIELVAAILFTISSADELFEWRLRDQNIAFVELDVLSNVLFYGFAIRECFGMKEGKKDGFE